MDAIGHISDRHFVHRPARKERLKKVPAHFTVQTAHAIHGPASADRQIGHIEILCGVIRVLTAQRQQITERDAELFMRVTTQATFDEGWSKTVKASGYSGMAGEYIARSCNSQCYFKGLPRRLHESPCAFQHREGRMSFIQVADVWLN